MQLDGALWPKSWHRRKGGGHMRHAHMRSLHHMNHIHLTHSLLSQAISASLDSSQYSKAPLPICVKPVAKELESMNGRLSCLSPVALLQMPDGPTALLHFNVTERAILYRHFINRSQLSVPACAEENSIGSTAGAAMEHVQSAS
jgi:hypothetical protein